MCGKGGGYIYFFLNHSLKIQENLDLLTQDPSEVIGKRGYFTSKTRGGEEGGIT